MTVCKRIPRVKMSSSCGRLYCVFTWFSNPFLIFPHYQHGSGSTGNKTIIHMHTHTCTRRSHTWLINFKFNKINKKIQFPSHTSQTLKSYM